jgi:hypothetical protein
MPRQLSAPRDPQTLGDIIAVLRILSGERSPETDLERSVVAALTGREKVADNAKHMILALNSTSTVARHRLLGAIADPGFRPSPPSPSSVSAGGTGVFVPIRHFLADSGVRGSPATEVFDPEVSSTAPVYTIRYQGLFCQQETSWDRFSDSDEIYVITSAVHVAADGANIVRTERHPVQQGDGYYGDVDSGEERVGPVAAAWKGAGDPVSLTVIVMEHDDGDPDKYKDTIHTLVEVAVAVLTTKYPYLGWLDKLDGVITDAINWVIGSGDDVIDTTTVILPQALMETYTSHDPGFYIGTRIHFTISGRFVTTTNEQFQTHLMYHFYTENKGDGATYIVCFDIDRDPSNRNPNIILRTTRHIPFGH